MKAIGGRCALHGEVNCPDCDLDAMLEREPDLADSDSEREFSKCAHHMADCYKALTAERPHETCKSHLIKAMGALNNLREALGDWQEAASADPERVNSQQ